MSVDRFSTPLYGISEAAGCLDVPSSTLATWAYGYARRRPGVGVIEARPVVTAFRPTHRHEAAVPFIGLAEAYALAAFRQAGVPMQRIRPTALRKGIPPANWSWSVTASGYSPKSWPGTCAR